MNILDILMIILGIGIFIGAMVVLVWEAKEEQLGIGVVLALFVLVLEIIPFLYFLVR